MRVVIAGLGAVARTHLAVLERIPGVDVLAGVDSDTSRTLTFRGLHRPVYGSVREASGQHHPDIVVIATPTPAHAAMCEEAAACLPGARLLVEKPAAASLPDVVHIIAEIGKRQPVDIAYHMSFSPEVTWGLETIRKTADLGDLTAARIFFADPYCDDFDQASATLGTSWIDSGINALSVLNQFAAITGRRSLREMGTTRQSVFEGRLTCRPRDQGDGPEFEAVLLTSWHVTDPAKSTRLRFSSGAELIMDHTAVAGFLIHDGGVREVFGSDRSVSRRERHYRALYQWWLTEGRPVLPADASLHLHKLLLDGISS